MVETEAARDGGVQARHVQAVGEGSEPKSGREGNSLPWLGQNQTPYNVESRFYKLVHRMHYVRVRVRVQYKK